MSLMRRRIKPGGRGGLSILILCINFWLTACTQPEPTPFPTVTAESNEPVNGDVQEEPREEELQSYASPQDLFRISLPTGWAVAERGLTPLGVQYALGPEPLGPGPETSFLYVADAAQLSAEEAAERLLCDAGCADRIELEDVTLAGQPAQRALLGDSPQLEWFFVPHAGRLIFFTIHDPLTFDTREDLLKTLELEALATPHPTTTPRPSPTETPTPMPQMTVETVREWQEVSVSEAGLTFEVPAQWEQKGEYQWAPPGNALLIGFRWQQTMPEAAATDVLPGDLEVISSEPLSLTWGSRISTTVQVAEMRQRHLITQVGLRTYDFYSEAPTFQALDALHPVLQDVVNSMVVTERLLFHADPVDASIEFFRELLRDPASSATRSYLDSELLAQLDQNPEATALLNLPQPFHTFNLEWVAGNEEQAVLQAMLTLMDDSTAIRNVYLTFNAETGWRIDRFEEVTPPASAEE